MKWKTWALSLLCCAQLATASANVPIMPIKDIQPGMQGVAKTVFQGDTIEDFPVEVIGVSGSEGAGYGVLVRLHGPLIEKAGGVAQGMSGSPVYIDGRLVGAVAYGKTFNDPHYCFLTPIGDMLKLIDVPKTKPVDWIPKGTALMASGFSAEGLARLNEGLAPLGLNAVAGGEGTQDSAKPLEPGSSVAAALMVGDLRLGALGTVTWTDDEGHILAFGHPFMQRGDSNFYMNKVWVLGCIPNMQSSYKVGTLGSVIGSFNQDRASGIGGVLGKNPLAVPVYIAASDTGRGINQSTRVDVIKDEKLLPVIVDAALTSAVSKAMNRAGGGTARLKFEITGVDSKKQLLEIKRENMYYASDALLKNLNVELNEATSILMQNKLDTVDLYGINIEAEINDETQIAEIKKVEVPKKPTQAGKKVPLKVTLKPYRGEEFTQIVEFKVPEKQKPGKMTLTVRGGSSMAWVQKLLRKQKEEGTPTTASKKEKQTTLQDFVKSVNEADCNNELIVDLSSGKAAKEQENDAGLAGLLKGSPYKQKYPYDFIIDGESEITLNVEG